MGIRNTINDPKLEGKIPDDDTAAITKIVDETVSWLDTNQTASKEDYETKKKEVEVLSVHFCKRWLQLLVAVLEECLVACREECPVACREECLEGCPVVCLEGCPVDLAVVHLLRRLPK